jgi:hypothetical protein
MPADSRTSLKLSKPGTKRQLRYSREIAFDLGYRPFDVPYVRTACRPALPWTYHLSLHPPTYHQARLHGYQHYGLLSSVVVTEPYPSHRLWLITTRNCEQDLHGVAGTLSYPQCYIRICYGRSKITATLWAVAVGSAGKCSLTTVTFTTCRTVLKGYCSG